MMKTDEIKLCDCKVGKYYEISSNNNTKMYFLLQKVGENFFSKYMNDEYTLREISKEEYLEKTEEITKKLTENINQIFKQIN